MKEQELKANNWDAMKDSTQSQQIALYHLRRETEPTKIRFLFSSVTGVSGPLLVTSLTKGEAPSQAGAVAPGRPCQLSILVP